MTTERTVTEVISPARISFDGGNTWFAEKHIVTRVDDWLETPFGRINFGQASIRSAGLVRVNREGQGNE